MQAGALPTEPCGGFSHTHREPGCPDPLREHRQQAVEGASAPGPAPSTGVCLGRRRGAAGNARPGGEGAGSWSEGWGCGGEAGGVEDELGSCLLCLGALGPGLFSPCPGTQRAQAPGTALSTSSFPQLRFTWKCQGACELLGLTCQAGCPCRCPFPSRALCPDFLPRISLFLPYGPHAGLFPSEDLP